MGHQIGYITMEDKPNSKKMIMADLNSFAYDPYETSCYHGNLTFHDNKVYNNREEAEEAISRYDNGWYSDHAVLFKDCERVPKSKSMETKLEQIRNTRELKTKFDNEHNVSSLKADFIGCKNCGSKVSRRHLRSNRCPVCSHDLRAEYILEKLKGYDEKVKKLNEEYTELEHKLANKAKVCWLVKYEYHC